MPDNEDLLKNFSSAVVQEIENIDKTMLPLLREYLGGVRDVRMSIGREVQDIANSTRTLAHLSRHTQEIKEFCDAIDRLSKILTPEIIEKLRSILKYETTETN